MSAGGIGAIAVLSVGVLTAFMSYYTVPEGYRGVILRNGAMTGVAEPGLGFATPFITSVTDMSIQDNTRTFEELQAYSSDLQVATMRVTVNYRIPADQVATVYQTYGGEEGVLSRLLDRQVYEEVKTVFGKFTAETSIQDRGRLGAEVQEAVQAAVHGPLVVVSVQIENVDFSNAFEGAVEARMQAEIEVERLRQNAEREKVQAEITVTQAQAQADSALASATAQAEATRLQGEANAEAQLAEARARAEATQIQGAAEASAIQARAEALGQNPFLIQLTQAENWNGALPTMMVPGDAVPMLDLQAVAGPALQTREVEVE